MNCTSGASCSLDGSIVFPSSAVAFFQKIERVSCGSKVSRTVGMISAFSSLVRPSDIVSLVAPSGKWLTHV